MRSLNLSTNQPDQLQHPEWGFNFESNYTQAHTSRLKLLNKASNRRSLVLAYHEPFPGLGYVRKTRKSYTWVPATTELLGNGVATQC